MDDGEVDFSEQEALCGSSSLVCDDGMGMENFLDEILKNTHTCTHTHTCNPPGPDNTHTHTCFHTHTQLFASPEDSSEKADQELQEAPSSEKQQGKKKRPSGNREAVRKYREKKKAHAAYLEEQVAHLKALNQQLLKRLQGQAALEAEVARLRQLLSEFRGRIDAEFAAFPYKRPSHDKLNNSSPQLQPLAGGFYLNSVSVPCDADVPCFHGDSTTLSQPQPQPQQLPCDYVSESCQAFAASFGASHPDGL